MQHQQVLFTAILAIGAAAATVSAADGPKRIQGQVTLVGTTAETATLTFESAFYDQMRQARAVVLEGFPLSVGLSAELTLERFRVTTPGAQIVVQDDDGPVAIPYPDITLWRGTISDDPDSLAFLSVRRDRVNGIVSTGDGQRYVISSQDAGVDGTLLSSAFELSSAPPLAPVNPWTCGTVAKDVASAPPTNPVVLGGTSYVAFVAVDGDWQFRNLFPNVEGAAAYALEIMGVIDTIYYRDAQIRVCVPYLRIWNTSSDPYSGADLPTNLDRMRDYWEDNMGHVERDVAMMFSARDFGGGRAGDIGAVCDSDAYAVNGGLAGTFPRPPQDGDDDNWDIVVTPHELGHLLGSPHTHCYDPPIDTCAGEDFDCENPRACQQGTLMSYCHTCPGGIGNMNLRFSSRVVSRMRGFVSDSCIRVMRSSVYVDWRNGGAENGTSSNPYDTANEGICATLDNGTVRIASGSYNETLVLDRPMTLLATGGTARIGD